MTRGPSPDTPEVALDVDPKGLRSLIEDGKLTFSNNSDLELETYWLYVHGGELQIAI